MGQALKTYLYVDTTIHCYIRIPWGGKQVHVAFTPKKDLPSDNVGWLQLTTTTVDVSRIALSLMDGRSISARFVEEKDVKLNKEHEHTLIFDLDDEWVDTVVFEIITINKDEIKNKVISHTCERSGW